MEAPEKRTWPRLLALFGALAALFVVARATGLTDELSVEGVRRQVQAAGVGGALLFVGLFVAGLLFSLPGNAFLVVGLLVYGKLSGAAIGFVAGVLAVSVSFVVVRAVSGRALTEVKNACARKILDRLERRPVAVVALLRLLFQFSPPVNYALAMSPIRFRDYAAGSAIGLAPVVLVVALASDCVLS